MYQSTGVIPTAEDVSTNIHDANGSRIRVILLGRYERGTVRIHVEDRETLDALQAALDEIRADMDASETPVAEPDGACIDPLGHEHYVMAKAEAVAS